MRPLIMKLKSPLPYPPYVPIHTTHRMGLQTPSDLHFHVHPCNSCQPPTTLRIWTKLPTSPRVNANTLSLKLPNMHLPRGKQPPTHTFST